jgi:hypothetical protein
MKPVMDICIAGREISFDDNKIVLGWKCINKCSNLMYIIV